MAHATFDREAVAAHLDYPSLIDALADAFRGGATAPHRHHHTIDEATLLLMPAWIPGRYLGTKIVTAFPGNGALDLPMIHGLYTLFCGRTGALLATLDGAELTARRTVAASALAARHLARPHASRLLIVGTGQIATHLAAAHAAVRPIADVEIWGRNPTRAAALAARLTAEGYATRAVDDLPTAVAAADIVSCCTPSEEPLVLGAWLSPGTHIDLIGGFTPTMREVDDAAIARAHIVIDTEAALTEAGDLVIPLRHGVIQRDAITTDLASLVTGRQPGRRDDAQITLFKSVGAAIEDLAAAILCHERAGAPTNP